MMFIRAFLCIVSAFMVTASGEDRRARFDDWSKKFAMRFENNDHTDKVFSTWLENDDYITLRNEQNLTYTLGHNQFSGMDGDEFTRYLGLSTRPGVSNKATQYHPDLFQSKVSHAKCMVNCVKHVEDECTLDTVKCIRGCKDESTLQTAESVDWVSKGAVTDVKNQGQCGSCWSFSTTGALEGANFVKHNTLVSLSEQQLVDCDNLQNGGRDHGCNGGLMDNAFTWIEKNGGLCQEASYPYISGETKKAGTCMTDCDAVSGTAIADYYDVPSNSDDDMMTALNKQPVSIAIQADQKDFQLYNSGVFTGDCGTQLDHGVLVVGYGSMDGVDYYRVKNSWGTSWGKDGYIYLGRGSQYNSGSGQCGMLMQGSYPEVE